MLLRSDLFTFKTTLGKLWFAGTVGVKKSPFSRTVIEKSTIEDLVVAIFQVENPLSPRLSGIFLRGLCAIYQQKCHLLQLEVQALFRQVMLQGHLPPRAKDGNTLTRQKEFRARKYGVCISRKRVKDVRETSLTYLHDTDTAMVTSFLNQHEKEIPTIPLTQLEFNQNTNKTPLFISHGALNENAFERCSSSPYCCISTFPMSFVTIQTRSDRILKSDSEDENSTHGRLCLHPDDKLLDERKLYEDIMHGPSPKENEMELQTPRPVLRNNSPSMTTLKPCKNKKTCENTRKVPHGLCRDVLHTPLKHCHGGDSVQDILQLISPIGKMKNGNSPTLVVKQKHVGSSIDKFYDHETVLDDGTLTLWTTHISPLLRPEERLPLPGSVEKNKSVWEFSIKNISKRVFQRSFSISPDLKRNEWTRSSSRTCMPRGVSMERRSLNVWDSRSAFMATIEKLRGKNDTSSCNSKMSETHHDRTGLMPVDMAGVDLTELQQRALQKIRKESLASSYISDSLFEANDQSLTDSTLFEYGAPLHHFSHGFQQRGIDDFQVWNTRETSIPETRIPNSVEMSGCHGVPRHKSMENVDNGSDPLSFYFQRGYSLYSRDDDREVFMGLSPTNGLLPLSIETVTQSFMKPYAGRLRETEETPRPMSEEATKLLDSLNSLLNAVSGLSYIAFSQLVPPQKVDAMTAAHTFHTVLKLSCMGEIGLKQESFDGPILLFQITNEEDKSRMHKMDMDDEHEPFPLTSPEMASH